MLEDELQGAADEIRAFVDVARRLREELGGLTCVECGVRSSGRAQGWQALLGYDPREDEWPEALMFCPECAERESGE